MDPTFFYVSAQRGCAGFIIPSLGNDYEEYNSVGPRPNLEYDSTTKKVKTLVCDHTSGACQPTADYEYALITAFLKEQITCRQWGFCRPSSKSYYGKPTDERRKEYCYGSQIYFNQDIVSPRLLLLDLRINPYEMKPHTKECNHENCVDASAALYALFTLRAREIVSPEVFQCFRGWIFKLDQEVNQFS